MANSSITPGIPATVLTGSAVLAQYRLLCGVDSTRKVQEASGIATDASGNLILPASAGYRAKNPAGTFYTELKSGAVVADRSWTLPLADGSANQAMVTGGVGILSFSNMGFQKIYDDTLSSAATTFTVSPVDGNVDKLYIIVFAGVAGHAVGTSDYLIRPNNDSGANYGIRWMQTTGNGAATNVSGLYSAQGLDPGDIGLSICFLHPVTGFNRRMVGTGMDRSAVETIDIIGMVASLWNNSADNITSLVFVATVASGFGIGSKITIWRQI